MYLEAQTVGPSRICASNDMRRIPIRSVFIMQDEGIEHGQHGSLEEIRKMIREQLEKEGPAICDAGKLANYNVSENWRRQKH